MSKQSRLRARRHNKSKKSTNTAATLTFAQLSEATQFELLHRSLDALHAELYKKQSTWGTDILSLFYCELWSELLQRLEAQRKSQSKERAINMVVNIKCYLHDRRS